MCWFFWDATIFCYNFARWLQKIVATCDVSVFLGCYYLLWHFCKMIQKIVACWSIAPSGSALVIYLHKIGRTLNLSIQDASSMLAKRRFWQTDGCVCVFERRCFWCPRTFQPWLEHRHTLSDIWLATYRAVAEQGGGVVNGRLGRQERSCQQMVNRRFPVKHRL